MILDAVQGVLQPYILVLNDYSALVIFSQAELSGSEIKGGTVGKKAIQSFYHVPVLCTGYALSGNVGKLRGSAKCVPGNFPLMRDTIKTDVAKTLEYMEENYM